MELILHEGEYLPDKRGGFQQATGDEALLQRALFRLTARRGAFPLLPELGSRLHLLGREKPANRLSAAYQYAVEALEAERELTVEAVELTEEKDGHFSMRVALSRLDRRYDLQLQL